MPSIRGSLLASAEASWMAYLRALSPYLTTDPSGLKAEKEFAGKSVSWTGTLAENTNFSNPKSVIITMGMSPVPFVTEVLEKAEGRNVLSLSLKEGSIDTWRKLDKSKPVRFRATIKIPYIVLPSGGKPILLLTAVDAEPIR